MSLTSINIAKITHWLAIPKEHIKSFSMANLKRCITINYC